MYDLCKYQPQVEISIKKCVDCNHLFKHLAATRKGKLLMLTNTAFVDLSFTTWNDATRCWWTPERPDDYGHACALGREYAAEFLLHCKHLDDRGETGLMLNRIMAAMVAGGVFGGVEVGFWHAIGERIE
jgi:hypothetical protein